MISIDLLERHFILELDICEMYLSDHVLHLQLALFHIAEFIPHIKCICKGSFRYLRKHSGPSNNVSLVKKKKKKKKKTLKQCNPPDFKFCLNKLSNTNCSRMGQC